jgi:ferredoxin
MATPPHVARVWIEDGCIGSGACARAVPEVFILVAGSALIRGEALVEGLEGPNVIERDRLTPALAERSAAIIEAAEACPVAVIRFEVED